jgi:hypothetical protein
MRALRSGALSHLLPLHPDLSVFAEGSGEILISCWQEREKEIERDGLAKGRYHGSRLG